MDRHLPHDTARNARFFIGVVNAAKMEILSAGQHQAARGTAVLVPPDKKQRAAMPSALLKVIAEWRNRIETTFSEITDRMELARHGAHSFWGLLTRTAATIAAHALLLVCLTGA